DFGLGEVFRVDDVQHVAVARGQPGRVDQQFAGPGGREDPDFFARQVVAPGGVGLLDRLADLGRVDGVLAPVGQEARHVDLAKPEEHGGVLDLAVVAEHIAVAGARDHGRIAGGVDDAPGQNHRPPGGRFDDHAGAGAVLHDDAVHAGVEQRLGAG